MSKEMTRLSKFLSLILRHEPEKVGLVLEEGGWVEVSTLLRALQKAGHRVDELLLQQVVRENDKQRFAFNEDSSKIRANQGHSVRVDLGLHHIAPPDILYHGTATRFLESILATGLQPQSRTHVHLSPDYDTAVKVGTRHGKPVVLSVQAGQITTDGFLFYRAYNGVWLTDRVPTQYIHKMVE
jgi:putative RNA 2'-phosphotransferase